MSIDAVLERERAAWLAARPKARALHERARGTQLHGTPHHWMHQFPPPVPLIVERAEGARLYDVDGHVYADFGLAASAALWGHTHPAVVSALRDQLGRGSVTMWPTEDHVWVTEELHRRFGLPFWQFTVSATDANRFALVLARAITGRPRVLVFSHAYHGTLEEPGTVEFNDLPAVERILAAGDVAAVLAEPAMTNGGSVVWPEPGFHSGLRELTRRCGTLLILDETQTIPAGPGGLTREFGLQPDLLVLGKCMAGGVPSGLYGMTDEVAARAAAYTESGDGGMGSTLAGGALAVRAMRAVLGEVMTDDAYARMFRLAAHYEQAVAKVIAERGLPWHVTRLGARVSYAFLPEPPRNAGQLYPPAGGRLRQALWLYLANRGIVLNGMSGAALFSPQTEESDVDLHNSLFPQAVAELT